jgi:hypothetical protein
MVGNLLGNRRAAGPAAAAMAAGLLLGLVWLAGAVPAGAESPADTVPYGKLTLVQAVVCEQVEGLGPKNPSVAFPMELGEVVCFTNFDPVPEATVIYHQWYFRDVPSSRIRLRLRPPRWSSFSRIQLRPGDAGPWRVEVLDADERPLATLRFSVVE